MISEKKLVALAKKYGVGFGSIEKDFFLTMLLEGISENDELRSNWIFKGGTALKKVFFENYRFSEDLDFTLLKHSSKKEIEGELLKTFEYLKEKYGAIYRIKSFHENKGFFDVKIQFDGLRGGRNTIALDLMSEEITVEEPEEKSVLDEYNEEKFLLKVYSLEEILAEKLRSLLQRTRVRDYYDCWFLLKHEKNKIDFSKLRKTFEKKMKYKKIELKQTREFFDEGKIAEAKVYYERQLKYQTKELPEFDEMIEELRKNVEEINFLSHSPK